ncbi:MAG: GIY-YIG nuclease family protein [Fusobacteriaceae bacterium]
MTDEKSWIDLIDKVGFKFVSWAMGFNGNSSFATICCKECGYSSTIPLKNIKVCPICNRVENPIITAKVVDVDAVPVVDVPKPKGSFISLRRKPAVLNMYRDTLPTSPTAPAKKAGGYRKDKKGYLYFMLSSNKRFCKIGISNVPDQRMEQLTKATPFDFKKIAQFEHDNGKIAQMMEASLHRKYKDDNCGFKKFDGASEWFFMTPALMDEIEEITVRSPLIDG